MTAYLVKKSTGIESDAVLKIIVSDIRNSGEVDQALRKVYGIKRQGR